MIIEEAEKERRRRNSKEILLMDVDNDDSPDIDEDVIGTVTDKMASRGMRRSFRKSLKRNSSVVSAAESVKKEMGDSGPGAIVAGLGNIESDTLLPRKNRTSLRYHAMTNSVAKKGGFDLSLETSSFGAGRNDSSSSEEGSPSPGSKRRGRLNTIYKKPVQRRRRRR